tara:strand:+ start:742 stop:1071 length:330 start_codon:yes stop_codon:yes gene_type:complete
MFNKKLFISLIIFSGLMFFASIIKNETRIIEKSIAKYKNNISKLENKLHEAELDYHYLSSPSILSSNIKEFSDEDYSSIKHSSIYFSLEQFLNEKTKTTQSIFNEKKKN